MNAAVVAVSSSPAHTFSKPSQGSIRLLTGLGVEGDAHFGETVKHRSRVARDPSQPNLRQVHLIHAELHDELQAAGFSVSIARASAAAFSGSIASAAAAARRGSISSASFFTQFGRR